MAATEAREELAHSLPDPDSKARGTVFVALREAAIEVWGEHGAEVLANALPEDVRRATVENLVVSVGLYPERYVVAWFNAAYETMARRSDRDFFRFLDNMMDHGFGRVRRALLRLATPAFLLDQAESLWRHDHSHGTLKSEVSRGMAKLKLTDHDYVRDPISRSAVSEIYRYGVQLTGAQQVTATHVLTSADTLTVILKWRA